MLHEFISEGNITTVMVMGMACTKVLRRLDGCSNLEDADAQTAASFRQITAASRLAL